MITADIDNFCFPSICIHTFSAGYEDTASGLPLWQGSFNKPEYFDQLLSSSGPDQGHVNSKSLPGPLISVYVK